MLEFYLLAANVSTDPVEIDNICLEPPNCITNSWEIRQYYDETNEVVNEGDQSVHLEFAIFDDQVNMILLSYLHDSPMLIKSLDCRSELLQRPKCTALKFLSENLADI